MQPLREEIEAAIEEQGWSKASIANMTKLDSFVKETLRLSSMRACTYLIRSLSIPSIMRSAVSITRKTMKDFTFSDGTTISAGNLVTVAAPCIHTDPVRMYHRYPDLGSRVYAHTGQLR